MYSWNPMALAVAYSTRKGFRRGRPRRRRDLAGRVDNCRGGFRRAVKRLGVVKLAGIWALPKPSSDQ